MRVGRVSLIVFSMAIVISLGLTTLPAFAVIFGGIDFPDGASSFADTVITYNSLFGGGPAPTDGNHIDPLESLGPPDFPGLPHSVSLGKGGLLELGFTDNVLTNSGDAVKDIHIFEIGPDVEDTFVAIRPTAATAILFLLDPLIIDANGDGFYEIGKVSGATSSIDIDSFFPAPAGTYTFDAVQLIDDPDEGNITGGTVGADIDSVGAITSTAPPPELEDCSTHSHWDINPESPPGSNTPPSSEPLIGDCPAGELDTVHSFTLDCNAAPDCFLTIPNFIDRLDLKEIFIDFQFQGPEEAEFLGPGLNVSVECFDPTDNPNGPFIGEIHDEGIFPGGNNNVYIFEVWCEPNPDWEVINFQLPTFGLVGVQVWTTSFNDDEVGGTFIPIDQSALLLAGVQSISMWMIPVVIAGIGIGIFVIKRRK